MAFVRSKLSWKTCAVGLLLALAFYVAIFVDVDAVLFRILNISQNDQHESIYRILDTVFDLCGAASIVYASVRLWNIRHERHRRKDAESRVNWMAAHDSLTGLYNRHSLEEQLDTLSKRAGASNRFAMLVIDLDGFKKINDLVGHHAGDVVLQTIADRMREHASSGHVFRYGGDEFVIFLENPDNATDVARSVLQSLNRPVSYNDTALEIGASIGMAICPDDAGNARDCLRSADAAMYAAKAAGRGSLRAFDKSMQERMIARDRAERSLREAIRNGEIQSYYQPIIDLQTQTVSGFEALARWKQPDGDFISPADFIPLAEESGLITELTERLLRQACRDAVEWPSHVTLSFNISPVQLQDKLLGLRILKILTETGLQARRLEVEITESALVQDVQTAAIILSDLRTAGISVALDDFGTGYSSLAQLSNFSFDKIKIDRSFVASFQDQERQEKIVKAIVGLGLGLEVPTTAEGIETRDQLSSLVDMGCSFGQGYLFGRAVPGSEASVIAKGQDKQQAKIA